MRKSFFGLLFLLLSVAALSAVAPRAHAEVHPHETPAAGVQLGNVWVPREKFVVFLMIGHCNMMGQAKTPDDGSFHPRAWQLDVNQRPPRWIPAQVRNNYNNLGAPTLPFLQVLAAQYPDYHFGVINNATSAATVQANYRRGKSNYKQIVGLARSLQPYATLGGVATMMGYMEAQNAPQTQAFGYNFVAMAQEMRTDLDMPTLPFFITQYEVGATKKGPGWTQIVNTIEQIPQHIGNAVVISTADFAYDSDHHPSYGSFKVWAMRVAQAVSALSQPQWPKIPDITPPQFKAPDVVPDFKPAAPVQKTVVVQREPQNRAPELPQANLATISAPPQIIAEVEAVLVKASQAPNPRQISPYKEAVASAQYEVKQVLKGKLDAQRVLAMQVVIEKGQLLPMANLKTGATYRLKLGSWNSLPRLHTYPMSDEIMDFESPIFFVHSAELVGT